MSSNKASVSSASKPPKQSSISSFFSSKPPVSSTKTKKDSKPSSPQSTPSINQIKEVTKSSEILSKSYKEKPLITIPANPDNQPSPPRSKRVRTDSISGKKVLADSPISSNSTEEEREDIGETANQHEDCSDDLIGKKLRVYWPDDKKWYEGRVKSFDKSEGKGKHVIEYLDGEEESLDLKEERVEWLPLVSVKKKRSVLVKGGGGSAEGNRKRLVKVKELVKMEEMDSNDIIMSDAFVNSNGNGNGEGNRNGNGDGRRIGNSNGDGNGNGPKNCRRKRKVVFGDESEEEDKEEGEVKKAKAKAIEEKVGEEEKKVEEKEVEEKDDMDDTSEDEDWGKKLKEENDDVDMSGEESEEEEKKSGGKWKRQKKSTTEKKPRAFTVSKDKLSESGEFEQETSILVEPKEVKKESVFFSKERNVTTGGGVHSNLIKNGKKCDENGKKSDGKLLIPDMEVENFSNPVLKEQLSSNMIGSKSGVGLGPQIVGDIAERFGGRMDQKFPFLAKDPRDAKMRRPSDPNYDGRMLHIPENYLNQLSGGQRQWWQFKAQHMDKVLLFKMGKFYEMFEMDAHVGAQDLDLQYMKGDQPHCGFPEKNYADNAERLVRKGYRVLVVEQTETPDQLEQRKKETGAKDKVVRRDVCAVLTKGTLVDGEMLVTNPEASYLVSIMEIPSNNNFEGINDLETAKIGLVAVDTAAGRFLVGQFLDDSARTKLRGILSELRPVELIKPTGLLSVASERALRDHTRQPLVNYLMPKKEFWSCEETLSRLEKYFGTRDSDSKVSGDIKQQGWPSVLRYLSEIGAEGEAAISAFGGCVFYLSKGLLDQSLLSIGRIEVLPGSDTAENFVNSFEEDTEENCREVDDGVWKEMEDKEPKMVLDSAALENLEILENSWDGGRVGTLINMLDHCVTPFGKRRLREWLARPLLRIEAIRERQDAIAELKGNAAEALGIARKALSGMPDVERILARLHSSSGGGSGRNAQNVVLYEDAGIKHLKEFTSALKGCQAMANAVDAFTHLLPSLTSERLKWLLTADKGFPGLHKQIDHFKNSFDWGKAEETGRIFPTQGVDEEFDLISEKVRKVEAELNVYLQEQRKKLGNPSEMVYANVGKDPYQMEVPDRLNSRVPKEYELKSQRKGFRRYWTPTIRQLLIRLTSANEEKETALRNILQNLRSKFCSQMRTWSAAVQAIAELDVLGSLTLASSYIEGQVCRPLFISEKTSTVSDLDSSTETETETVPFLSAKALRHPVVEGSAGGGGGFVPNDTQLGGEGHPSFLLLTGPNMGGKSTLLRQICLAVVMAQIGADVPAKEFSLTPVDRVFVRMGAKDHIMANQSTFLVELSETASMLKSATRHSLVALDELGRGTATSDGQAIAHAVLQHLSHVTKCRGLFSTHYHRLADEHANDPQVSLRHMACKVGLVRGVEEVTFLYKLVEGACPKSYGVNVARLAGMPEFVLERAVQRANEMEKLKSFDGKDAKMQQLSDEKVKDEFIEGVRAVNKELVPLVEGIVGGASLQNDMDFKKALQRLQEKTNEVLRSND